MALFPVAILLNLSEYQCNDYGSIKLSKYDFIYQQSATFLDGVGFYIKNSIDFSVGKQNSCHLPFSEDLWAYVSIEGNALLLGVVYRHSSRVADQIDQFSEYLHPILQNINLKNVAIHIF